MALSEETSIVSITIDANGTIFADQENRILRDGVTVAADNARLTYAPGADLAGADPKVKAYAAIEWTPEVTAAYQARLAATLPN